jgi:hypothetical protein
MSALAQRVILNCVSLVGAIRESPACEKLGGD